MTEVSAIPTQSIPATPVFSHPPPSTLARNPGEELPGRRAAAPLPDAVAVGTDDEPIALVGMACRYPGGVTTPEGLWQLVLAGRDAVGAFPTDRGWDTEGLY
ncbi:hypothetical protein VM98_33475, partial [Streptomyces rubellomurinus subsp. indigoferus]